MDWCPSPQSQPSLLCANTDVSYPGWGETYGPDSLCLRSTAVKSGYSANLGSGCYHVICSALQSGVVMVVINVPGVGKLPCPFGATSLNISGHGFSGFIECTDPYNECAPHNPLIPVEIATFTVSTSSSTTNSMSTTGTSSITASPLPTASATLQAESLAAAIGGGVGGAAAAALILALGLAAYFGKLPCCRPAAPPASTLKTLSAPDSALSVDDPTAASNLALRMPDRTA